MSLSLISGKLAFLHDGYIAVLENYCMCMVVKYRLFAMCIASLLLGISFNMILAMRITSGVSFNTKL